jgi:hypothetical protein
MNFGPDHYVPALKLKMGEKDALATLKASVKSRTTPLLQIVEMNGEKTLDEHLSTSFKKFQPAVSGLSRYFVDSVEIDDAGALGAGKVFGMCAGQGVPFTPVIGLSRAAAITTAGLNAKGRAGVALRISRQDFEDGVVATQLPSFLRRNTIEPGNTDLIIDLGEVADMIEDGIAAMAEAFIAAVPQPLSWRTLALLGSAFPISMQHVGKDSHATAERTEWVAWRDRLYRDRLRLPRLPAFGDWGIQHPKGVEGFDPVTMQGSAAIRYALDSEWLLIKGRGTKKSPPSLQMPTLARALVNGIHKRSFAGASHCSGCDLIDRATRSAVGLGSLTKWRQIGTAHHITATVEAIQRLPWP